MSNGNPGAAQVGSPVTGSLDEYAKDRLQGVVGDVMARTIRTVLSIVIGYAATHKIPFSASDQAWLTQVAQVAAMAGPACLGKLLREMAAKLVGKYPKQPIWSSFQKFVSWLPF